jgi:hypothetical protein
LEDDEDAERVARDTDGRHDPVDVLAGSPAEDEEADGGEEDGGEGGDEARFLGAEAVLGDVGLEVVEEVGDVDGDTEDTSDEDAEEGGGGLAKVHVVDLGVDDWEGFEEGVVGCVDCYCELVSVERGLGGNRGRKGLTERCVHVDEENGWIQRADLNGLDERVPDYFTELQVRSLDLRCSL